MRDVFISHVEEDADITLELARGLEQAGYITWYFERDSIPGPSYLLQTGAAVDDCRAFVLVISPHSLGSNQVTAEVVRAHEGGRPFIPVLRGVSHAEFQGRQPVWRQAVGSASSVVVPPEGVGAIVPRLVAGLKAMGINPGEAPAEGEAPQPFTSAPPLPSPGPAVTALAGRPFWRNPLVWAGAGCVAIMGLLAALVAVWLHFASPIVPIGEPTPGAAPGQPTAAQPAVVTAPTAAPTIAGGPTRAPGAPAPTPLPAGAVQVTQVARQDFGADSLAWSPDGTLLYLVNDTTRAYDVQTQTTVQEAQTSYGGLGAVISADRTRLALPGSDGVAIWDLAAWSQVDTLASIKDCRATAFSPDNTLLYTQTGETVKVWDVATGQEVRTIPSGHIDGIAASPDGAALAIGSVSEVMLVDPASGQEIRKLTGANGFIGSLAFSPDGALLAGGGFGVDTVQFWDVASGGQKRTLKPPAEANVLAFSADGRMLAAGCGLYVEVWDVATGKELAQLTGHSYNVTAVGFSPDGTLLASATDGELRLWQLAPGSAAVPTAAPVGTPVAMPSPVPLSAQAITAANAQAIAQVRTLEADGAKSVAWTRDGHLLAVGASESGVYDASTLDQVAFLDGYSPASLAFSPAGTALAVVTSSSEDVRVWDPGGGGELVTLAGSRNTSGLAYAAGGTLLLTQTGDAVKVWDAATGQELRTIPSDHIDAIAVSPDGQTLAIGGVSEVTLVDIASAKVLHELTGASGFMSSLAFSPDGTLIAASGWAGEEIRMWDVAGGLGRRTIKLPENGSNSLAFSPDGSIVAAGCKASAILWDVATGKELRTLTGHTSDVQGVAFSPDGALLATAANDGVRFWGLQ